MGDLHHRHGVQRLWSLWLQLEGAGGDDHAEGGHQLKFESRKATLRRLEEAHALGLISDEEYAGTKAEVLRFM